MVSPAYELSIDAQHDIESILNYTLVRFGADQVEVYGSHLVKCMEELTVDKGVYRILKRRNREVRMLRCQKHVIFALSRPNQPLLVIAVLYQRMDLIHRLSGRL